MPPPDPTTVARRSIAYQEDKQLSAEQHSLAIQALMKGCTSAIDLIPYGLRRTMIPKAHISQDVMDMPPRTLPALHALADHAKGNVELIHCAIVLVYHSRPQGPGTGHDGSLGIHVLGTEDVVEALVHVLKSPEIEATQMMAFEEGVREGYLEFQEDAELAIRKVLRDMKRSGRIVTGVSSKAFVSEVMGMVGDWLGDASGSEIGEDLEGEDRDEQDDVSGAGLHETFLPEAQAMAATAREGVERDPPYEVLDAETHPQVSAKLLSEEDVTKLIREASRKAQEDVFSVMKRQADDLLQSGRDDVDATEFIALVEQEVRYSPPGELTVENLAQLGEDLEERRASPSGEKQPLGDGRDTAEQPHTSPRHSTKDAATAEEVENGGRRPAKGDGFTILTATGVSDVAQDATSRTKPGAECESDGDLGGTHLDDDSLKANSATMPNTPIKAITKEPVDSSALRGTLKTGQQHQHLDQLSQPARHMCPQEATAVQAQHQVTTTTELANHPANDSPSHYDHEVHHMGPSSTQARSTAPASASAFNGAAIEAGGFPIQDAGRATCRIVDGVSAPAPGNTGDNTASSSSAEDETLAPQAIEIEGIDETVTVAEPEVPSISERPLTKPKRQRDDSASPGGDKKRLSQERED